MFMFYEEILPNTGPHDNPVRWAGQMLSASSCLNTREESDAEKLGDFLMN